CFVAALTPAVRCGDVLRGELLVSNEGPSASERGPSSHVDAEALRLAIDRLVALATGDVDIENALAAVIQSSHEVFGLAGTGVMIFDELDVLRYVAASDERARGLEKAQEQTGEGPCVDAAVYARVGESVDV